MSFLTEKIEFRVRPIELAAAHAIVSKNPELFENMSHFCRCALIKFAKEWQEEDILKEK